MMETVAESLDKITELMYYTWCLGNNNWADPKQTWTVIRTMQKNLEQAHGHLNEARRLIGLPEHKDWPFDKT